jgi:hypothetical protein
MPPKPQPPCRLLMETLSIITLGTSRAPLEALLAEAAAAYRSSQRARTGVWSVDQARGRFRGLEFRVWSPGFRVQGFGCRLMYCGVGACGRRPDLGSALLADHRPPLFHPGPPGC